MKLGQKIMLVGLDKGPNDSVTRPVLVIASTIALISILLALGAIL